jgi:hypothetical protein
MVLTAYHSDSAKVLLAAALVFLLAGCAGVPLNDRLEDIPAPETKIDKKSKPAASCPGEPQWNHVTYRGTVRDGGGNNPPIGDATVSIYEGNDRLVSTLTDEQGKFVLPSDLYGCPCETQPGASEWRPESYYVLIVEGPKGRRAQRLLRDASAQDPIELTLR